MDNQKEQSENVQRIFDRPLHWQSTHNSARAEHSTRYLNTLAGVVIAIQEGCQRQASIAELRQLKKDSLKLDIKSDAWHSNKKRRDDIKGTLPCFSLYQFANNWRKTENFKTGSDLVCIDLDDLTPVTEHSKQYTTASDVRDLIAKYDACICAFVSPSGLGVKAIFYTPTFNNKDELEHAYRCIKSFVYKDYGLMTDDQASKITSTINLSHDADIYSNIHPIKLKLPIAILKPARKAFVHDSSGIDSGDYNQSYIESAITQEMLILSTSECGTHNKTLYKCSAAIFSILAGAHSGGKMDSIEMELLSIAQSIGHETKRAMRTIKRARNDGESNPRKGLPRKESRIPRKLTSFVNQFKKKSTTPLADFINKTNNSKTIQGNGCLKTETRERTNNPQPTTHTQGTQQ